MISGRGSGEENLGVSTPVRRQAPGLPGKAWCRNPWLSMGWQGSLSVPCISHFEPGMNKANDRAAPRSVIESEHRLPTSK